MKLLLIDHLETYDEAAVMQLIDTLPAWRRDAALRYRFLNGKRESALAYLLLCRLLRQEYGIEEMPRFAYGEHGKPYLPDYPHIHFSMSHCREAIGCLVDDHPCGLDIEHIRTVRDGLVRYTMNEQEQHAIATDPRPDVAFTRLWTKKEALLKQKGTGIGDTLTDALSDASCKGLVLQTEEHETFVLTTCVVSSLECS